MQAKITLGTRDSIESKFDVSNYDIEPALSDLYRLMLSDETCCLPQKKKGNPDKKPLPPIILHKEHDIVEELGDKHAKNHRLFLVHKSYKEYFTNHKRMKSAMPEMRLVNQLITDMIESHGARIYPSCFDSSQSIIAPVLTETLVSGVKDKAKADSVDAMKIDSKRIEREEADLKLIASIEAGSSARAKAYADTLAAYVNLANSTQLKNWVDEFYLPYCKRKAKSDVDEIVAETSWIWRDIQLRGIAISVTTLLLLVLFYLEMIDLKLYKIRLSFPGNAKDENEEEKEVRKGFVEELNKKADYLLFPLTMTISVIGLLLIPVTSQTEIASITPGKSFWMMNVPSLNMPDIVEDVVVDNGSEEEGLAKNRNELLQLKESLDSLNKNLGNMYIVIDTTDGATTETKRVWKSKGRLQKLETKLTQKIGSNAMEIKEARDSIDYLESYIDLLKKQLEEQDKQLPD